MKIRENKQHKLDYSQVRALYRVHGTTTRDFAASLLGGDPFQAQRVVRNLFRSMVGMGVDTVASAEKLPLWIADQVVARCLVQTGNETVGDWEQYLEKEEAEGEEEGGDEETAAGEAERAEEKVSTAKVTNVIPFRPRAEKAATRAARATLASSAGASSPETVNGGVPAASDGHRRGDEADRPEVPR
jgi:hypothetical protein